MKTNFKVKIFADGAEKAGILELTKNPLIAGFTTNPTLMRKAGVRDYRAFAREVLAEVRDKPISFEVFSDSFAEMERQAGEIASWGANVYVKIPITDTAGRSTGAVVERLSAAGVKVNVTAIMTPGQVAEVLPALEASRGAYVSVFAGRIADAGRDPVPLMAEVVQMVRRQPSVEVIWASPREVFNLVQADNIGCHIITMTHDLLKKVPLIGRDLQEVSLDTVRMFDRDAREAGFEL